MKIAVTGKGGVGKTTIAATLARLYAEEGHPVLAADVDPDANLGLALGFPEEILDSIVPITKMRKLIEERTEASADNRFYKINPRVSDIPDKYSKEYNGVKLLTLGTVETAGSGCVCPEHVMLRRIINSLVLHRGDVVILDMEAGLEHLGRGTTEGMDMFIVVIEPGARSIQTYKNVKRLAKDLGVKVNFVSTEAANRIEYLQTGKVDVILANFTVTEERAQEVDFALPYMNVALGVVSREDNVIKSLDNWNKDDSIIVISGTTAETYLTENYPDIPLQKFDSYATAKEAFQNGTSVAWANDNTEVIAFALQNKGYTVGISELGNKDTIAPAVTKGNDSLREWINSEIETLGQENFFHKDYEETFVDIYGTDYEDSLVVEGGKTE